MKRKRPSLYQVSQSDREIARTTDRAAALIFATAEGSQTALAMVSAVGGRVFFVAQ